ncbi:aspartyl/asparaginyl beta-hydroxylase domain-containing protein [uncultured Nevskia sp.]|uniref:aspartyl/asparaginyl beta-hydroxylase domain-containing protein n=1 Tax=uncultured Nevskia sp. TaxID=228950 RepID=UPI0025DAD836|nr:aspartyl/asparaginyl beta-hydroxylase domain-containing protein [uncultured Nevskia sp.]
MSPSSSRAPSKLEKARQARENGDRRLAEKLYYSALDEQPDELEALGFVSTQALLRGDPKLCIQILEAGKASHARDGDLLRTLGIAYRSIGDRARALEHFSAACAVNPRDYFARLPMAQLYEEADKLYPAVAAYFGALTSAQLEGLWLDKASTPTDLLDAVQHAVQVVRRHRPAILSSILEPLWRRHGRPALRRIEHALRIYLREIDPGYSDSRQRPLFFYIPELPARPYFDTAIFTWAKRIEQKAPLIRQELLELIQSRAVFEPFHEQNGPEQIKGLLRNETADSGWDTYFLYRHGEEFVDHGLRCPRTASSLRDLPLATIRDHAPEALFSLLRPGTHILPHRGVTNCRLVAHLPLVVPPDCAIVVGGETHTWEEGRLVVFDDTFEHEAWNRSDSLRAVLILDIWHPDLDSVEREALQALIPAIGDFNRQSGL